MGSALPLNTYKLKISYCGKGFEGWQVQPEGHRTIQGELNKALKKISKSDEVFCLGSGRTDSGVHAYGQIVRISIPLSIEGSALTRGLNSQLPPVIRVLSAQKIEGDFHPVRDALWKEYQYFLYCGEILPPFMEGLWTHCSYNLDLPKMEKAIQTFIGSHDFVNFSTKGTEVSTTIRKIHQAQVELVPMDLPMGAWDGGLLYKFSFVGEGFLKQMVRLMVGTTIAAGRGKVNSADIKDFLGPEKDTKLAAVAPADGLYLKHVEYDKDWV